MTAAIISIVDILKRKNGTIEAKRSKKPYIKYQENQK